MDSKRLTERAAAAAYVLICAIAFAGCSSSDSAKQTQGSAATDSAASAAPAATVAAAQPASDDAAFPIYPNAKSQPIPAGMGQIDTCGHKQTITQYAVDADGKAVVAWYKSRLSNAVTADIGAATGDNDSSDAMDKNLSISLMQPDGSASVMVMQMHFASATLQAAAKTIDMDKTTISFVTYAPPLGSDYVQLMAEATGGDASARAAAKTKMAAMCPQDK